MAAENRYLSTGTIALADYKKGEGYDKNSDSSSVYIPYMGNNQMADNREHSRCNSTVGDIRIMHLTTRCICVQRWHSKENKRDNEEEIIMFEYMYDHTPQGKLELQTAYAIHENFTKEMRHLKSCIGNAFMMSVVGVWMLYFGGYDAMVGLIGLGIWMASVSVIIKAFNEMKHLRRR